MTAVLDVSAAIQIILKKEKLQLFKNSIESSSWIIAPDIFVSELTNTFWKYYRAGVINHDECVQYTENGLNLVDDLVPCKDLWKESLSEGIKNKHSIYNMLYMVAARRNDALLLTNDSKLAEIALIQKIEVII